MSEDYREVAKSDYASNNFDVSRRGDTLIVNLTYPKVDESKVKFVEVDQESVRASDGIRLTYDYERDGWSIQQPTRLTWPSGDEACDNGWKETAFVQSWHFRDEIERHDAESF